MTKKRQARKVKKHTLVEGGSDSLTVHRFNNGIRAIISRKVLRYLKVKPGDKIHVVARDGVIELCPVISVEDEIARYVSL